MKLLSLLKSRWLLAAVSVALLVWAYNWLSHRQHDLNPQDTTIPGWGQLAEGVAKITEVNARSGERWLVADSKATAKRLAYGLGIGVVASIALGLLMGYFQPVESFLTIPLTALAKVPPTAALAVFFVMVGTDLEMYAAMIAFGVLPTLTQSVFLAVREVPREDIEKALTWGASKAEILWNILFSRIKPKIIDAVRLQIGPALVFLIAAEMVCGNVGFGYRIRMQSRLLNMNVVYPYLACLMGFGFLVDGGLKLVIRLWCPWYVGRR